MVEPEIFALARAAYEAASGSGPFQPLLAEDETDGPWFKLAYKMDAALRENGFQVTKK